MKRRVIDRQKVENRQYIAANLGSSRTNLNNEISQVENTAALTDSLLQGSLRNAGSTLNSQIQQALEQIRQAIQDVEKARQKIPLLDVTREEDE